MMPGGTAGVPTAPRRMASRLRSSSRTLSGRISPVAQVAVAAQVVVDGVEVDAGRPHHLQGLGHDLRPDAVATDDADLVTHEPALASSEDLEKKTAHRGGRSRAHAGGAACATGVRESSTGSCPARV